jgi:hypothetical protein
MKKMLKLLYLFCLVKGSLSVMGVIKVTGSGTNVTLLFAIVSWPRLVDKTSDGTATGSESSLSSAGVDMVLMLLY